MVQPLSTVARSSWWPSGTKATRDLGPHVRAQRRVEAVDVEADVHLWRKRIDHPRALLCPGLAGNAALGELGVVEGDDAPAARCDPQVLFLAKVANPDLHQAGDSGQAPHHVLHHRRVRPLEALVGAAQVGVRMKVQEAEARVARGVRFDGAEGDGMVAADGADDLAAAQEQLGSGADQRFIFRPYSLTDAAAASSSSRSSLRASKCSFARAARG